MFGTLWAGMGAGVRQVRIYMGRLHGAFQVGLNTSDLRLRILEHFGKIYDRAVLRPN